MSEIARVVRNRPSTAATATETAISSEDRARRFFPPRVVCTGDWLAGHHRRIAQIGRRVWRLAARREIDARDDDDDEASCDRFSAKAIPFSNSRVYKTRERERKRERKRERRRPQPAVFNEALADASPAYSEVRTLEDFVIYYSSLVDYLASTRTVVGDAVFVRVRDSSPEAFAAFVVDAVFRKGDALATLFREKSPAAAAAATTAGGTVAVTCLWRSEWHRRTDDGIGGRL